MNSFREVTHKLMRRGGESCRASRRYDFFRQCGKSMNSPQFTDSLTTFLLSDAVGVSVETVELLSR